MPGWLWCLGIMLVGFAICINSVGVLDAALFPCRFGSLVSGSTGKFLGLGGCGGGGAIGTFSVIDEPCTRVFGPYGLVHHEAFLGTSAGSPYGIPVALAKVAGGTRVLGYNGCYCRAGHGTLVGA